MACCAGALTLHAASIVETNVWSAAMGKAVPVTLVLPQGYSNAEARRYSVAYMLHGLGGDHREYLERTKQIAAGVDRHGFVAVCPDGMTSSWWMDSPVDPKVRYETFVARELVAWSDANLRTRPVRAQRAIAGASMGGYGAMSIACRHTDIFGAVGSIHGGVELESSAKRDWDIDKRLGSLDACASNWVAASVLTSARTLRKDALDIFMEVGAADEYFLAGNRLLHNLFKKNGVTHQYRETGDANDAAHFGHNFNFQALAEPHVYSFLAEFFRRSEQPNAVFGVLSDVHLILNDARSKDILVRTLKYLDARGADGVVVCGDLTLRGTIPELMTFADVWRSVFPGDRRSDGGHVERLFIYGDHETENFYCPIYTNAWTREGKMEAMRRIDIESNDRALQWKRAFGEEFAPIVRKRVKGYDFVLAHFVNRDEPGLRWGEPLFIPGLEEFFTTNHFDAAKPFFFVQHKIPRGTAGGPKIYGQDSGRTTAILSKHPNAVAFCGHKHRMASDERSLWQGAFTSILVPAMFALQTDAGRENGACSGDRAASDPPRQMPRINTLDGSQGLVMSVYDDRLVLERREFAFGGEVAPPWIVPLPNDGGQAFDVRAERAAVPQFARGATVTARERRGRDRNGKATDQIEVSFPSAWTEGVSRAYDYEVRAVLTKQYVTRIVATKRVYSPKCHLSAAQDTGPVTCVFAKSEIPSDHNEIVFEVRPANAYGREGAAIRSEPRSFNPTQPAQNPW